MLVVGDREQENRTVAPRLRSGERMPAVSVEAFLEKARADIDSEPLKRRCSRKWDTPASLSSSSLVPVSTQHPRATERSDGISSLITRRPLGSRVI